MDLGITGGGGEVSYHSPFSTSLVSYNCNTGLASSALFPPQFATTADIPRVTSSSTDVHCIAAALSSLIPLMTMAATKAVWCDRRTKSSSPTDTNSACMARVSGSLLPKHSSGKTDPEGMFMYGKGDSCMTA